MRVVAGTARGRRLQAPPGRATRPTSDRVREATFNALASLGELGGAEVLDLFAGSGALGIEALSRGAAQVTFVDDDPRAVEVVRANLATIGLEDSARVVLGDARSFLAETPLPVDLALLDPPYGVGNLEWAGWLATLDAGVVMCESDRVIDVEPQWELLRSRRYGTTVVVLARHR